MIDLRVPLGLLFIALGFVMVLFGVVSSHDAMYARSLGINVNVIWGLVEIGFGAIVLWISQIDKEKSH